MWPGGGKASDACTPVPALPRACTRRRTGYLVPGPRHHRAEGPEEECGAQLLDSRFDTTTILEGEGEGKQDGRHLAARLAPSPIQDGRMSFLSSCVYVQVRARSRTPYFAVRTRSPCSRCYE